MDRCTGDKGCKIIMSLHANKKNNIVSIQSPDSVEVDKEFIECCDGVGL